jgi:hypothetical protein
MKYFGFHTSEESYNNKREDEFFVSPQFHREFFVEVLTTALKELVLPKVKALKIKYVLIVSPPLLFSII